MTVTYSSTLLLTLASLSAILSFMGAISIACILGSRIVDYVKNNFNEKQKRILHIILYINGAAAYIAMTAFAIWYFTTH